VESNHVQAKSPAAASNGVPGFRFSRVS